MADSITPANLPVGMDLYAGYIDGRYANVPAIKARFPGKTVIRIAVFPSDNEGDCLDVESGDATPGQAPAWVQKRRAAGHGGPLVYCSWALLPTVQNAFTVAGVPFPGFWVAGYPAPDGDAIPPGTVGHQWIDRGPYDESIMVDYLPGIDSRPSGPPIPQELLMGLPTGCTDQGAVRAQIREWWALFHTDPMLGTDANLFAYVFYIPIAGGGYGGDPDLLLAGIIDNATSSGTLRPMFSGAV